ncbi:hypothetical protein [Alteribacillus bidgolensis]|uniref:Kelch motif-containing protein n=1 Tax=Alteribacillus bidgolensis TaxID=930129 RepID=A0A1G8RL44_9BACI|nr:hypothetical protein [Alteribacillus bidgolensis]SDJ17632.1 Kelch motif-containing protein [Alteribacillus bidgolensis]
MIKKLIGESDRRSMSLTFATALVLVLTLFVTITNSKAVQAEEAHWQKATDHIGIPEGHIQKSIIFDDKMWLFGIYDYNEMDSRAAIWSSDDGEEWQLETDFTEDEGPILKDIDNVVVFDNKLWVIGWTGIWSSEDSVHWQQLKDRDNMDWPMTTGFSAAAYDGKLWVAGGYHDGVTNEVWVSEDGIHWEQATEEADWSPRNSPNLFEFADKLWLIGDVKGQSDVWYSEDGVNWHQTTEDAGWPQRRHPSVTTSDDGIWVTGGSDVTGEGLVYNDVWFSPEGKEWKKVTEEAAWGPRFEHASIVYDDKLWVMGGVDFNFDIGYQVSVHDVWYYNLIDEEEEITPPKAVPPEYKRRVDVGTKQGVIYQKKQNCTFRGKSKGKCPSNEGKILNTK